MITGTNLNNDPIITFNGQNIEPTNVTNTAIKLKIPIDASSGKLEIQFSQMNDEGDVRYDEFLRILDDGWVKYNTPFFTKIEFASENIAYATNQDDALQNRKLYKTIDGGETWSVILETNVTDFHFYLADEETLLVRGYGNIYKKTIDGGSTWHDITTIDLQYIIEDITFINKDEGYLFAHGLGKSSLFITTNGAESWTKIKVFNNNHSTAKFVYSEESHVYLYDYVEGEILSSNNMGINWEIKEINPYMFRPKVNFKDHSNAWFGDIGVSSGRSIYETLDGGKTLSSISTIDLTSDDQIINFNFLDENNAHVMTKGGASFYTSDGGETWQSFYMAKINNVGGVFYHNLKVFVFNNGELYEKNLFQ